VAGWERGPGSREFFTGIGRRSPELQDLLLAKCEVDGPEAAARPRSASVKVRSVAGPGHQRGGERRVTAAGHGDSLVSDGDQGSSPRRSVTKQEPTRSHTRKA
jgi:hypothetical protein